MEAPLVAFDDAGLLVRRGRRLVRFGWDELTHVTALPRGVWIGSSRDLTILQGAHLRGAEAAEFDPYAIASRIRTRWQVKVPGALDRTRRIERLARRPAAFRAIAIVCLITLVAYVWELFDPLFVGAGAFEPALVERGEWWRLVTANFLHSLFPLHVITTLLALPVFGLLVERPLGSARATVLMSAAGIASMTASGLAGYERVVGGSGVVAGLAGAVLALELLVPERLPATWRIPRRLFLGALALQIAFELVLGIWGDWLRTTFGLFLPSIASAAHAGGFATGFALAACFADAGLAGRSAGAPLRVLVVGCTLLMVVSLACLVPTLMREPVWLTRHAERALEAESTPAGWANDLAWIMTVEAGVRGAGLATALALSERAVSETERSDPVYLDTLAEMHFLSGDADEALRVIEEALVLAPGVPYLEAQRARFRGERDPEDRPVDPGVALWQSAATAEAAEPERASSD